MLDAASAISSPTMDERGPAAAIDAVTDGLAGAGYIASRRIGTALFLARSLHKPILVEGPAGVGKTELARAAAQLYGLPLVRMQCYEGLDEAKALYEWQYGKQLLYTQLLRDRLGETLRDAPDLPAALERLRGLDDAFFSEQFLAPRPLLRALREPAGAVLLIDEIDKADAEFEAFLLELLADYQVTIPEIGTITATHPPLVVLTSNSTRDLGDALKRRCLHLHIGFPAADLEERIVAERVPAVGERLRAQLVAFVQALRTLDLRKPPSVGETIDWARVLVLLHVEELGADIVRETLNVLLKIETDVAAAAREVPTLLARRPA
jgi:MoxR-like ATPase